MRSLGVVHMTVIGPTPPGFRLAIEMLSTVEEAALIELMIASGLAEATAPGDGRGTVNFGWHYDIASERHRPAAPIPAGFASIASRAAAFAGLSADDFVHCALNRYAPGATIESHIDMPCWGDVIGISLGTAATMILRKTDAGEPEVTSIELPPRSMYLLRGEARHLWAHALAPAPEPRWSITFRTLSEAGFDASCKLVDAIRPE